MNTQIVCVECGGNCTSLVPDGTVVRAYVLCPECQERIPEVIVNAFFEAAEAIGKQRRAELAAALEAVRANPPYPHVTFIGANR